MPEARTLRCTLAWSHPRRWREATITLPPLTGTGSGTLRLFTEDDQQRAELRYPLVNTWRIQSSDGASDVTTQKKSLVGIARLLDVAVGAASRGELVYETDINTTWHVGFLRESPALWDWPSQGCEVLSNATLADMVGAISAASVPDAALALLADAVGIANPVARYICMWQALAFLTGSDRPSELDAGFFSKVGVPIDLSGYKGKPESKYVQFRNVLGHPGPGGRNIATYEEIDLRARELSEELALLILGYMAGRKVTSARGAGCRSVV
jgi:hypothetical protein